MITSPTWHIAVAHAATLTAVLWMTSGVGLLVAGATCLDWRSLAGQMLIGFLGYTVLLAVSAGVGLNFGIGAALLCAYFLFGLAILAWRYRRGLTRLRRRLLLAAAIGFSSLSTS
ncbi:MAG TPA: hypothetical protein VGL99_07585, partial [Chloroflexota bacterium]